MKEKQSKTIKLYPSNWLYNAGLINEFILAKPRFYIASILLRLEKKRQTIRSARENLRYVMSECGRESKSKKSLKEMWNKWTQSYLLR
jgi:hypothetical protein